MLPGRWIIAFGFVEDWELRRRSITTGIVTAAPATATAAGTTATSAACATAPATAPSTAAPATTAGPRFPRSGFVDCQTAAVVFLVIQGVDCRPRFVVAAHLDETEALAPTCVAVGDNLRALYTAEL